MEIQEEMVVMLTHQVHKQQMEVVAAQEKQDGPEALADLLVLVLVLVVMDCSFHSLLVH